MSGLLETVGVRFSSHLDGGACLNQRAILTAVKLFGRERRGSDVEPLSMRDLLEGLWALDLMIAHTHVSVDGTLPPLDLEVLDAALDDFCTTTRWDRAGFAKLIPPREQQAAMYVDAAEGMFELLNEPLPGVDVHLSPKQTKEFFARLEAEKDKPLPALEAGDARVDELLLLGDSKFRGSKCVAAIACCGPEAIRRALMFRDQRRDAEGLAASALINRFRFGYLRHLAWEAGDTYVPGVGWRRLSALNTRKTLEILVDYLGDTYVPEIRQELGGEDGVTSSVLPPMALYCLMRAKPAHGPRSVIDEAYAVAGEYRQVLRALTKAEGEVTASFNGWSQATGNGKVDELGLLVERHLSETLGAISAQVARERGGNPSGFERHKTSLGVLIEGGKNFLSEVAKDATVPGIAESIARGGGALVGAKVAGPIGAFFGGAFAAMVLVGGQSVLGARRRSLRGHIDAYRGLDEYLTAPEVGSLHLAKLEEQVQRVLGKRLVRS